MSRVSRGLAAILLVWAIHAAAQTNPAGTAAPGTQIPGSFAPAAGAQPGAGPNRAPRDTPPQVVGAAHVSGRIITDTGQPLRHISAQLIGSSAPRFAITDSNGRYEFADLPAGTYTVLVNHMGYVGTRSDPVDLADGQRVEGVDIRVPRGGVITGQVLDEFGDPVIGATVSPLRQQYMNGQRRILNAGATTLTNDIGEFRLFGLAPGRYYVSVSPRNEQFNGPPNAQPLAVNGTPVGYAPTYYPGTPDPSTAQGIVVAAAQTVTNISFSLAPARLARVSGIAMDEQGQPVGRGGVILMRRDSMVAGGGPGGPMRPDGTFSINNVPPGNYYARVTIPPTTPGPPQPGMRPAPPRIAIAPVTVSGDDVSGVVLMPVRAATIRGRLVFDDPTAAASAKAASFRVVAQRLDTMSPALVGGPVASGQVNDDFTFELSASPERSTLRVASGGQATVILNGGVAGVAAGQLPAIQRPPIAPQRPQQPQQPSWRLKAVRVRGVDVIDTGVDLAPGETIDDVEIEMTSKTQMLSGTVTNGSAPVKRAQVIVFPQNRDLWTTASARYNGRATTDENGEFKIASLPPGSYYAVAAQSQSGGPPITDWNDPDVLEAAARTAASVSLAEGATAAVDLRLMVP